MKVDASSVAKRTSNPIRNIVDRSAVKPNPEKALISLSLGDPTVFGNLKTDDAVVGAVQRALQSHQANGYAPVTGTLEAKEAVAKRYRERFNVSYDKNDIVIASGCSGALELAISVLCSPEKSSILIPSPGFTLYQTLCSSKDINHILYPLLPNRNWEIDLVEVERLLQQHKNINSWLINNPSNPCGSVYSEDHLKACVSVAEKYGVVLVADEIYEDMTFEGHEYVPLARISSSVPVLTCSGLAKRFLVPGWRFGWVALHQGSQENDISAIRKGLFDLSGLIIGANTLIQAALPDIFENTNNDFFTQTNRILEANAALVRSIFDSIPGLRVIKPQGTLYMLVGLQIDKFSDFTDDVHFAEQLLAEQSVSVLPGTIFGAKNYFRIVFSAPTAILQEACSRIGEFCKKHQQ